MSIELAFQSSYNALIKYADITFESTVYDHLKMAMNHITILNGLPKFTGNPKPGEAPFKPEIDARTFMRTVENHFENNDVNEDDKKIQILFSSIDKTKGDAT